MPDGQMPPPQRVPLLTQPGIKRDGSVLDSLNWTDGQWVRFQRGRPKKIGGFRSISDDVFGPVRQLVVDARIGAYTTHLMSRWGVYCMQFDPVSATGSGMTNRTPTSNFTVGAADVSSWQATVLATGTGSTIAQLVCSVAPDLGDITTDTSGYVFYGDITAQGTPLATLTSSGTPIQVSGGCVAIGPFLFLYGSNGLIYNSNPNNISDSTGWTVGTGNNIYTNAANPIDKKIVKGMRLRGGSYAPAGLFWGLDQLVRVSFLGGAGSATTGWWLYEPLGGISIMSKNSVVEMDGRYYWLGVDRFYTYSGVVQEIPNQMNLNWFFDNVNRQNANKCWGVKVPRYGEIWWFYPRGSNTECSHYIVFNVREGTWYDGQLSRYCGTQADVFPMPIMAGGDLGTQDIRSMQYLPYTSVSGTFQIGDTVTGGTSGATGTVYLDGTGFLTLQQAHTATFTIGETITGSPSTATGTVVSGQQAQEIDNVWEHEFGTDKISAVNGSFALHAWITTQPISYPTGGPLGAANASQWAGNPGIEYQTRLTRLEPDFVAQGGGNRATGLMNLILTGYGYANSGAANDGTSETATYPFSNTTPFIDIRFQAREMTLTFDSNVTGGFFEMGRVIASIEQGDGRP